MNAATEPPEPSDDLDNNAGDGRLERYKAQLAAWGKERDRESTFIPAMAAILGSFAQLGLRSLYLVNGGALLAVLALLGNIWGKPGAADLASRMQPSAKELITGLLLAFAATAAAYLSQVCFLDFRDTPWGWRWGRRCQLACLVLCCLSLCAFGLGVWSGVSAIGKRSPNQVGAIENRQTASTS